MWLTAYETPDAWAPTEVSLLRRVTVGNRTDHAWAQLRHPIPLAIGNVDRVIIGARHEGFDVWAPSNWPMHVYICTVPGELTQRNDFSTEEVTIARWGLLHETFDRAQEDLY